MLQARGCTRFKNQGSWMTPEAARDTKKIGGQNTDFEGHSCSGIPKIQNGVLWMTPKAARNPKLGVILAKCAPMTPCPPLAQPLLFCTTHGQQEFSKVPYLVNEFCMLQAFYFSHSRTIYLHKLSHKRAKLYSQNVYSRWHFHKTGLKKNAKNLFVVNIHRKA